MKLRPVTFRYKQDPQGERQYGLIAEEVTRIYPELVNYDGDGKLISVRYHELIPMLLNELQKQASQNQQQAEQIRQLTERSAQEAEQINQQAAQNRRLSAQVVQLKVMFERAIGPQNGMHLASAGAGH